MLKTKTKTKNYQDLKWENTILYQIMGFITEF